MFFSCLMACSWCQSLFKHTLGKKIRPQFDNIWLLAAGPAQGIPAFLSLSLSVVSFTPTEQVLRCNPRTNLVSNTCEGIRRTERISDSTRKAE